MDINELRAILDVCRFQNYAEAAHFASVAPSVISKYVAKVENELGVTIFERATKSKPVVLTSEGRAVIDDIRKTVEGYTNLMSSAKSVSSGKLPPITLGFSPAYGSFAEGPILADFIYENPDVSLHLMSGHPERLLDRLMSNVVDGILITLSEWDFEPNSKLASKLFNPDIELIEIRKTNKMYVLVSSQHPLAERRYFKKSDVDTLKNSTILLNRRSTYVCNEDNFNRATALLGVPEGVKYISTDFSKPNISLSMINQHPDIIVPFCAYRAMPARHSSLLVADGWNVNTYMYFAYRKANTSRSLRKLRFKIMSNNVDEAYKLKLEEQ